MFTTITSLLIALSLVLGGTGAAVYASQDSQPGHMLYTLKTAGEDMQLQWTHREETKLQLALRFAARRMEEAQALAGNGQQIQESLALRLEKNLEAALMAAAAIEDPKEALEQIKEALQLHQRDCLRIQGNLPEDKDFGLNMVQNMFEQKLRVVNKGIEVPLAFKHAYQNRSGQEAEVELLGIAIGEDLDITDDLDADPGEAPDEGEEFQEDDPIVDEDTLKGPGYGVKNDTGESRGDGEPDQYSLEQGYGWGPGSPQAQPGEPLGTKEGSYGPGPQYSNPDTGNPDSGNPDSGTGGSSDNGKGGNKP